MHVVFLTNEYPTDDGLNGGIGSFVKFIATSLVQKGHKASVVGIYNQYEFIEDSEGVSIYKIAQSKRRFAKFYSNSKNIIKAINTINSKHPVDIVEGSELNFAFFPKKTTYKKVIRLHGGHHFFAIELGKKPAFWRSFQEKRSFTNADFFVAVSNYVGNQTKKYINKEFSFQTIYNSIDFNRFSNSDSTPAIKDSLLFIGTVCEKKGVRQLVLAMEDVVKENSNVKLKIVGRDWFFPDGKSYIEYLKGFITPEIKNNIEIVGALPHEEIPKELSKASICIYPSLMESFGIVIVEAMAMQKPIIASNIGPFKEILTDNHSGSLVEPNDPKYLANAIVSLLNDDKRRDQLSKNAKKIVMQKFSSDTIVKQNIEFYKSIL